MQSRKTQISAFAREIEDGRLSLDTDDRAAFARTVETLGVIEITASSECGNVDVYASGIGQILDVVITDGAMSRLDHRAMGEAIVSAINAARSIVHEGIRAVDGGRHG